VTSAEETADLSGKACSCALGPVLFPPQGKKSGLNCVQSLLEERPLHCTAALKAGNRVKR